MSADDHDAGRETRFSEHAATILATEHWSLLASRSLAYNESFSRVTVFLTVLSASFVGLALVANTAGVGTELAWATGLLTPLVLFLGITTYTRLVQLNLDDVFTVGAINRLRHAYLEMAPELRPYFTTGWHDDPRGVMKSLALVRFKLPDPRVQAFVTTPTVIAFVNAFVAAIATGLVVSRANLPLAVVIGAAALVFILLAAALLAMQFKTVQELRNYKPRFPSDPNDYSDEMGPVSPWVE